MHQWRLLNAKDKVKRMKATKNIKATKYSIGRSFAEFSGMLLVLNKEGINA